MISISNFGVNLKYISIIAFGLISIFCVNAEHLWRYNLCVLCTKGDSIPKSFLGIRFTNKGD